MSARFLALRVFSGLAVHSRYIADYLSQEALARQEPAIRAFLLKTSVVARCFRRVLSESRI